jgi:hypothetical protein
MLADRSKAQLSTCRQSELRSVVTLSAMGKGVEMASVESDNRASPVVPFPDGGQDGHKSIGANAKLAHDLAVGGVE